MAASFSIQQKNVWGAARVNVVDVTLDGSYAAGGYTLTPANLGVATIQACYPAMKTTERLLPMVTLGTTPKLAVYKGANTVTVTSGNAQFSELATNDTLISASTVVRLLVVGDQVNKG